jgi:hypothetical protein
MTVTHHGWSIRRVQTQAHITAHGTNIAMLEYTPVFYSRSFADVAI